MQCTDAIPNDMDLEFSTSFMINIFFFQIALVGIPLVR